MDILYKLIRFIAPTEIISTLTPDKKSATITIKRQHGTDEDITVTLFTASELTSIANAQKSKEYLHRKIVDSPIAPR